MTTKLGLVLQPTTIWDRDKFVSAPNGQPAMLVENTDVLGTKIVEVLNPQIRYVGRAGHGSLTSDPVWQIYREVLSGVTTTTEYLDKGNYNQVWDNRASLFPGPVFADNASLIFDGVNDYITTGIKPSVQRTASQAFSYSFWFKSRLGTGTTYLMSHFNTSTGHGVNIQVSNRVDLFITGATGSIRIQSLAATISAGVWAHWAITYDGSMTAAGVKIYKNGVLQTVTVITNTLSVTWAPDTRTLAFGYNAVLNNGFLDGHLDDMSFWDSALTVGEVVDIFNAGKPGNLTLHSAYANLISWWWMGDGDDTFPTIQDREGDADMDMVNMVSGSIVSVVP